MIEYFETGKEIAVPSDKLFMYCINVLKQYDSLPDNEKVKVQSPYTNVILYPTDDKKFISVPDDIQKQVINEWMTLKIQFENSQIRPDIIQPEMKKLKKRKRCNRQLILSQSEPTELRKSIQLTQSKSKYSSTDYILGLFILFSIAYIFRSTIIEKINELKDSTSK